MMRMQTWEDRIRTQRFEDSQERNSHQLLSPRKWCPKNPTLATPRSLCRRSPRPAS
uniref:Alternative protein CC2D2A n=1 Tax=Homo sapiens TaxID=9606 RepID=L8EC73_HUMAN|nr:alternative protein CC2D2A [Homo sapiens]